jgi:hypothetical protein
MKLARVYTGDDGESHVESLDSSEFDYVERDGTRTEMLPTISANFLKREAGPVGVFHNAPQLQYVVYLTASVEIGCGDGSSIVMEPGDVLRAEDTTGNGHTSHVLQSGMCMFVPLAE